MSYKITLTKQGGIENFLKEPLTPRSPNANEVLIEQRAVGLNFIDIYHREGLYPLKTPLTIGQEAAGIIIEVGSDVTDFKVGDRVAYAGAFGAYATHNTVPAERLVHIPDSTNFNDAAASLLRGGTASYLLFDLYPLKSGETALIHAGAGGVGQILIQWAKAIGAKVITTVGSEEKRQVVEALGADLVINYRTESIVERVRSFIPDGVDVVYDGVGKDTFEASLDSLKLLGMMVSYGNASGAPPDVNPLTLLNKGALFLTRPNLNSYTSTPERYQIVMNRWMEALDQGIVNLSIYKEYSLEEVGKAQTELANRKVIGAIVLTP